MNECGLKIYVTKLLRLNGPAHIMKTLQKKGLGQSIGLGFLFAVGCAGMVALMSYAAL